MIFLNEISVTMILIYIALSESSFFLVMDIYAEICSCQRIQCKEKKMNFKIQKYLINNIAEGIIKNIIPFIIML